MLSCTNSQSSNETTLIPNPRKLRVEFHWDSHCSPENSITNDSVQFPAGWKMKAACGSEKNLRAFPLSAPSRTGREVSLWRPIGAAVLAQWQVPPQIHLSDCLLCTRQSGPAPWDSRLRPISQVWTWEDEADGRDPAALGRAEVAISDSSNVTDMHRPASYDDWEGNPSLPFCINERNFFLSRPSLLCHLKDAGASDRPPLPFLHILS